ncbi:MAG: FAD linked oxidase protein [uncultured bacterium]|nr:MAG: FAD linked oxidase protein [uncultured bacterium]
MSNTSKAIHAWRKIIGPEWVNMSKEEIHLAETTSFFTTQTVKAILYPKNTDEVSRCVKIANQYLIPIYPISCGKNWGYGSKVPVTTDSVIIDLSRMNQILELNEKLAYVIIEPGVTQSQLFSYLEEKTSGTLWLDTVASSPHTSLIGNAMERGHGTTPYCDRISHCCHLQVVLPNGEIIDTGYGAFPNCKTKNLDSWGLGPAISH